MTLEDRVAELESRTLPNTRLGPSPKYLAPDPKEVDRLIETIKEKLRMPHYADGTPAQVGDFVKGKPYNTPHEVVGTLIQITPGSDVCNCIVAFADVKPVQSIEQFMAMCPRPNNLTYRSLGGVVQPEGRTEIIAIEGRTDYGEVRAFTKIA